MMIDDAFTLTIGKWVSVYASDGYAKSRDEMSRRPLEKEENEE